MWVEKCAVNSKSLLKNVETSQPAAAHKTLKEADEIPASSPEKDEDKEKGPPASVFQTHQSVRITETELNDSSGTPSNKESNDESTSEKFSMFSNVLASSMRFLQFRGGSAEYNAEETEQSGESSDTKGESGDTSDEEEMVWTDDGPPKHWASKTDLENMKSVADDATTTAIDEPSTVHIASNTFAAVSRTLQENVLARFQRKDETPEDSRTSAPETHEVDKQEQEPRAEPTVDQVITPSPSDVDIQMTESPDVDPKALLEEVDPEIPKKDNALWKLAGDSYDVAKVSATLRRRLSIVSFAGGIAGGVAGLVLAGPTGAILGAKCGQAAGVFSVVMEGGLTVSVFVASAAAAAGFTVHQLHRHQQKRVLTIGEDGIERRVLLVRPNVWVDPAWEEVCAKAKRNSPSNTASLLDVLTPSPKRQAEMDKQQRSKKDSDIVVADEIEIPTPEKVLLLVNRHLNSKLSLPGHVYRTLIEEYRRRVETRKYEVAVKNYKGEETTSIEEEKANEEEESTSPNKLYRARRQDAHAVIKYVTATLLEVRPGFAASPTITEMSATAVEGLVFGEIYGSVFEEIREETRSVDDELMRKILDFEKDHPEAAEISDGAVEALAMVPGAHSAVDKLRYCVNFLEEISDYFADRNISADNLLKMVCQHILAAKVPDLNAEVAFLEEFARDEQLLRGKEGYALVTLQASLHFLNSSNDFDADIFYEDD